MKPLIVLVIGGSVLTDRTKDKPNLDLKNINVIVSEIKKAQAKKNFDLVIVHGMGSFGHPIAKEFNINKSIYDPNKLRGRSKLAKSLTKLNTDFVNILIKKGLNAIHFESSPAITDRGKIIKMRMDTVKKFLSRGFMPVLQAYPVYDKSYGISILSSDHLGPYLAKSLKAKLLIGGTSIDGVYDRDPKMPNARLLKKITPNNYQSISFFSSSYADVTGGMLRKVTEYLKVAESNVNSRIINITRTGTLSETILGKSHGTLISK